MTVSVASWLYNASAAEPRNQARCRGHDRVKLLVNNDLAKPLLDGKWEGLDRHLTFDLRDWFVPFWQHYTINPIPNDRAELE